MDALTKRAAKLIQERRRQAGSYRLLALELRSNKGLLNAVARGKRAAPNSLLHKLGLPYRKLLADVCPIHGVIHRGQCPRPARSSAPRDLWDWTPRDLAAAIRDRRPLP